MTRQVFLSYARRDEVEAAALARDLRAKGANVFSYREEPRVAEGPWQERIKRALEESDAVVIIASQHYRDSEYCDLELAMMRCRLAENGQLTVLAWSPDGATIDDRLPVRNVSDRASLAEVAVG